MSDFSWARPSGSNGASRRTDGEGLSHSEVRDLLKSGSRELRNGEIFKAHDILGYARGLCVGSKQSVDPQLRLELEERYLLASASLGNQESVISTIGSMLEGGAVSENLFGLAGRCCKDLYRQSGLVSHLKDAEIFYRRGFEQTGKNSYYLGVNAASCAIIAGDDEAIGLTKEVLGIVEKSTDESPWKYATIGECHLAMGDMDRAGDAYRRASKIAAGDLLIVTSMRRQARWLLKHKGEAARSLDECFDIGPLIMFSGHLPDGRERAEPRFPVSSFGVVRDSMRSYLEKTKPSVAFLSAAAGADLLLLECLIEKGIPFHLVLPCPERDLYEVSVLPFGEEWCGLFDTTIENAVSIRSSNRRDAPAFPSAWSFAIDCLVGFSLLHADANGLDVESLTVWDGLPGYSGGTGSFVELSRSLDVSTTRISPTNGDCSEIAEKLVLGSCELDEAIEASDDQVVRSIVFADVVGFSRLRDEWIPDFVTRFFGEAANLLDAQKSAVRAVNTWGDALSLVFDDPVSAGKFCLELIRRFNEVDWVGMGMHEGIELRVSCHAGPVCQRFDPITERDSFFGLHVNQAARIEPVTPPGMIYVSEEFAALSRLRGGSSFAFEIVGSVELAKGFGRMRVYRLLEKKRRVSEGQNR